MLTRSMQKVPYVALDETTWGAYESELRGQLRSSLRRCRRRLEEKGRLSLEIFDGKKWLEELLEEGFRVEGSGWKHAAGTSIYSNPATRVFYTKLAQWAAERGWLRLAFLRLSGVTMAFDYCLEYNRTHYMLKIGYDPAYAKFSPGSVLRQLMIARAFSEGIATYELLGGFEAWKRDWANAYHELQVLHIFTPEEGSQRSWYGQLQMAIQDVAGAVPSREMFVLIDEDSWQIDPGGGRQAIPFVERNGTYWGLPADDETAIQELEKSRQNGANYIVIGWPAFWWLEYYDGLRRHLRSRYRCMLENDRVIVFDLQRSEPTLLRK
jgi:Acetyltransferase (GNAT) domain